MTIQEILEAHMRVNPSGPTYGGKCQCGHDLDNDRVMPWTQQELLAAHRAHVAEVLERHMREREANAWESGYGEGALYAVCIRSHLDGLTEQDPKRPTNPYRTEPSDGH